MNIIKDDYLQVNDIHKIHFYQVGNKEGKSVIYVHGGPGGGADLDASKYFDLDYYNVIIFDQRGCGKSLPFACVKENTTFDLVEDMEKLRKHLNIEKWSLFGGSWGSTLSLVYAINHPERVENLILRGIFLARDRDTKFLYQEGANYLFPDKFEKFVEYLTEEERKDTIKSYIKYLTSENKDIALKYAKTWAQYEVDLITLLPNDILVGDDIDGALAIARIECHYFENSSFLEDNYILNNCDKIKDIKTYIVHGRYDVVCPFENAYLLSKKLNNVELNIIDNAGHSSKEIGINKRLVEIMNEIKE